MVAPIAVGVIRKNGHLNKSLSHGSMLKLELSSD